jgi:hypothetical protein
MDESTNEQSETEESQVKRTAPVNRAAGPADHSPLASGLEINLGDFTRTQVLMRSLRLTLNQQIVVQVEELASGVSEAGRKFKMGDVEQANLDVARLYSAFGQKTNQWDSQARNLEQQTKMQAARNPRSVSIDKLSQMRSEQTAVRTRIRTAEVQFRRLHQGLEQAYTMLQNQPPRASSDMVADNSPADLAAEFLASFQAAPPEERPALIQQHFEIEAELTVRVSRGAQSGYEIRFSPAPHSGSLMFFPPNGQLLRLQQLGDLVAVHNLETGQDSDLKLAQFVKQVQSGAWLLKRR